MFTVAVILLSPCVMLCTSRLLFRRRESAPALVLFEYLADALFLLALTLLLFTPIERVTVSPWSGHPLSFTYGKTAALFNLLCAFALGALEARLRLTWKAERDASFRAGPSLKRLPLRLLGLLTLFAVFAYLWGIRQYPVVSLEEIEFHLLVPLEGTTKFFVSDLLLSVLLPTALLFVLYALAAAFPKHSKPLRLSLSRRLYVQFRPVRVCPILSLLLIGGTLSLLLACCDRYLDISHFIYSRFHSSTLIEEEYVDPAKTALRFPEEKRNLINIYLESGETTFQDVENGGVASVNYTPEMTAIARENLTFSQSDLIQGAAVSPAAGWTIAGLFAQTAGLPLKLVAGDNMGDQLSSFLPGVTSLGDLLRAQGYRLVFMAGSDFTFGGRRQYFTQHGDYEIWDLLTAREQGLIPETYYAGWGFEDRKLYEYAKTVLTELAAGDQPFHFSMLTVDTHSPGFSYECCPDDIADPYLRIVACASRQLGEFIDWCAEQPFFEHTTIVITGDHSSMALPDEVPSLTLAEYDKHGGSTDRLVYNAFINAVAEPVRTNNRLFTTLDFFPTVLASIGVEIDGDRLGLGTNLFSDRPTLSEEYGYQTLFSELSFRSNFYNEALLYPKKEDEQ